MSHSCPDDASSIPPDLQASHICWPDEQARAATWRFIDNEDGDPYPDGDGHVPVGFGVVDAEVAP